MTSRRPADTADCNRPVCAPDGEFEWIEQLTRRLAPAGPEVRIGVGDDAAVLEGHTDPWVWTVDTLVEGVHFRFDWLTPEHVGYRALAASLSDLAAMGARPVAALVTLAGPAATFGSAAAGIYDGLAELARAAVCPIVGGDISRADGPFHLTVTALGRVEHGTPLTRGGARPGDDVWVTGVLGAPAAAIALLAAGREPAGERAPELSAAMTRLARPSPRLDEIAWLVERASVHAAIDVSDGLSGDVRHVAERSGVAIELDAGSIPVHPAACSAGEVLGKDPFLWAVHGGEEFELVIAVPSGTLDACVASFTETFGIALTKIGSVGHGTGVTLRTAGDVAPLAHAAWDHFRSRPSDTNS